ncbi:hypothetical protein EGR_11064 [Echinococcus granulosus]|uniref:Uncharacterized protein n=1 Tax=Echinococcus granulosus TaxID=6210 RepID=W6U0U9_ECHGR|nr:hypothetical protein EGR_11064 [Echinococcus granulosus]EUB54076.1 hypothetical protein EGR_11064 [Echinococcus granulosus]
MEGKRRDILEAVDDDSVASVFPAVVAVGSGFADDDAAAVNSVGDVSVLSSVVVVASVFGVDYAAVNLLVLFYCYLQSLHVILHSLMITLQHTPQSRQPE